MYAQVVKEGMLMEESFKSSSYCHSISGKSAMNESYFCAVPEMIDRVYLPY